MPVEEPRLSCPTAKTRPECGKASTCSIEIKFNIISKSSDAYRVGGCSLNPVAASVCLMLVREAALSTRFCMKCSTIHMHSMESPTFPTSSTLQKSIHRPPMPKLIPGHKQTSRPTKLYVTGVIGAPHAPVSIHYTVGFRVDETFPESPIFLN